MSPPHDFEVGQQGNKRLELVFLEHTCRWLKQKDVLVFVIPRSQLKVCARWRSSFSGFRLYRLTEPECIKYNQVVMLASRRGRNAQPGDAELVQTFGYLAGAATDADIQAETSAAHAIYNNIYIWMISLVAALGGLLFGYDWVVIGGAKPFYEKFFGLYDPAQQGWAMSCALIGCLLGAMLSGALTDKFGRKRMLLLSAMLFASSSIGTALSNTFGVFVSWRIAGGLAIGLASSLSPMYIAEVSPATFRGKLVSINQLTIVIGVLLAQIVNWLIARPVPPSATATDILNSWNGQVGWRWMFGVTSMPAALFLIGTFLIPESPRWLAAKGVTDKARRILARVGGDAYSDQALAEIRRTLATREEEQEFLRLRESGVRKPLLVGIVLAVFQQWCGINVIFNYADELFSAAGFKVSDILFNIVLTGAVNLIFTLVAMNLVDRVGRRALMLVGAGGLALIYISMGYVYHAQVRGIYTLVLVVAAIACYAASLAPATWVVISEIFPNRVRGLAISIAVSMLWIASFVLTYTFPRLNHNLGAAGTFWIYALVCAFGFVFIKLRLPETRGRTLEEIEASWLGERGLD